MKKIGILIFSVITIGLVLSACGGGGTPTPPATPPAQTTPPVTTPPVTTPPPAPAIDAKALYAGNCAACHGQKREGVTGLGPALTPTSLASKSLDNVKERITEGKSGTAMPGFAGKLKPEEINALADFVKTIQP